MTIQAKMADFLLRLFTIVHRFQWNSYAYQFSDIYANVAFHIGCAFIAVLIFKVFEISIFSTLTVYYFILCS